MDQNADSYGEDDWEVMSEEIFEVERDVMIGCFALRRLLEMSLKVTQDIRGLHVKVTAYPLLEESTPPDVLEALNAFKFYDMKNPRALQLHIPKMCNLFIHSHVLHFAWDLVGMIIQESYELEEDDPRIGGLVELGGFYVSTDIRGGRSFFVWISKLWLTALKQCFMTRSARCVLDMILAGNGKSLKLVAIPLFSDEVGDNPASLLP